MAPLPWLILGGQQVHPITVHAVGNKAAGVSVACGKGFLLKKACQGLQTPKHLDTENHRFQDKRPQIYLHYQVLGAQSYLATGFPHGQVQGWLSHLSTHLSQLHLQLWDRDTAGGLHPA